VASDALLASLRAAVAASPDDVALRVHLAQLLAEAGERAEAVRQAGAVLQHDPENAEARRLISAGGSVDGSKALPTSPGACADQDAETLRRLDAQLADVVPPMFADPEATPPREVFDAEAAGVRLADVGGMAEVKARLEAAFLAPLRNPELARLYGKSLRGGLLLYGPPGCGKTFIARALAGEINARFLTVSLADVLDMWVGQSERNVREIFDTARHNAPCVVFLDEIDALGQKRSQLRNNSAVRGAVNQLLSEMDGVENSNDGVYVLAATNHPWDVDVALRRPGRFDRTLLVLPPDEEAREAMLRYHLRDRPIANIDVRKLARKTDGYSGADLAYVCQTAAEQALLDSARSAAARLIEMRDLEQAVRDVRPSIGSWLELARNVAQFANDDGTYDDLVAYLRQRRVV
jgi:SpoVK/Ycf46/Vps4 family AAA+-type ATPase